MRRYTPAPADKAVSGHIRRIHRQPGFSRECFRKGDESVATADPTKGFDAKGRTPSKFTIELQNGLRKSHPFEDMRDFEEAKKAFIAAPTLCRSRLPTHRRGAR